MHYAYYGNTISTPQIVSLISPHASNATTIAIQLAIFVVAALPGYAFAITRMDRVGHHRLQLFVFVMMGVCFAVIGLVPGMTSAVVPFLIAYGISYFFTEFDPKPSPNPLSQVWTPSAVVGHDCLLILRALPGGRLSEPDSATRPDSSASTVIAG